MTAHAAARRFVQSVSSFLSSTLIQEHEYGDHDEYFDHVGGGFEDGDFHQQHRNLAGAKYRRPFDYSILAVGIITLALLICAEALKHHLDHAAKGRPFFHSVLDGVKEELSTLGIVELVIFLLVKYYKDLNVPRELVFADVHFTLFYTAIFNAFQSVCLAFASWRVSNRLWVQTESLELDHYVEIREEFDRLHERLYPSEDQSMDSDLKAMTTTRRNMVENNRKYFTSFEYSFGGIKAALQDVWMHIRFPILLAKYNRLLIQVRFHQLRIHFLESNGLPLTLKVSDYLKKAESAVLIRLVHISTVAWLFLVGALNLFYYVLGMVAYSTEDAELLGVIMKVIFFSAMFGFILVSLVLYNKMKKIFSIIINWKRPSMSIREDEEERNRQEQRDLFWQGDPQLVIALIQVMQFGYAIALAFLLIYWQNLQKEADIQWYWFLLAVLACYSVFCLIIGKVIPQYTLCTSMGHLLRVHHLQQTVAQHELQKAQKEQRRKKLLRAILEQQEGQLLLEKSGVTFCSITGATKSSSGGTGTGGSKTGSATNNNNGNNKNGNNANSSNGGYQDDMTIETRASLGSRLIKSLSSEQKNGAILKMQQMQDETDKTQLLARLVKTDTVSLRSTLPEEERQSLQTREERMKSGWRGRSSRRTLSDGVAQMRQMSSTISNLSSGGSVNSGTNNSGGNAAGGMGVLGSVDENKEIASNERQKASHLDRADLKARAADDSTLSQYAPTEGSSILPQGTRHLNRGDRKAARRANRHKAVSASAIIQSWQDFSVQDSALQGGLGPLHEEHHSDDDLDADDVVTDPNQRIVDMVPPRSQNKPKQTGAEDTNQGHKDTKNDGDDDTDERASVNSANSVGELSEVDVDCDLVVSTTSDDNGIGSRPKLAIEYVQRTWRDKMSDAMSNLSPAILRLKFRRYFMSKRYHTISHVFGSVVVYFLIGNRIEAFLAVERIIKNSDQTWEIKLNVSFWWQATWYMLFILASFMVFALIRPTKTSPKAERVAVIAAVLDLILSGSCLAILLYAEADRCCNGDGDDANGYINGDGNTSSGYLDGGSDEPSYGGRRLADDEKDKGYEEGYHPYLYLYYDPPEVCSCPDWGMRTYGGLGIIEPFTGLIALRVFRFVLARRIVEWSTRSDDDHHHKPEDTSTEGSEDKNGKTVHVTQEKSPFRELLFGEDDTDGHGHGHHKAMVNERGSALELWHKAVMKYPDIVAKYGEFSGELFRAMLGLELEDPRLTSSPILTDISGRGSSGGGGNGNKFPSKADERGPIQNGVSAAMGGSLPMPSAQRLKLTGRKYAHLPPSSQGIIIAGKLGKPVKACSSTVVALLDATPPKHGVDGDGITPTIEQSLEFEVDMERLAYEASGEEEECALFVAPSARIVRSMRRCDRKLLPLLDTWVAVDVVMTQFEIVYLEVNDEEEDEMSESMHATFLAIQATKGGKGLRLCDVARGRKIVGHLDLSEVTEVHVERDMPDDSDELEDPYEGKAEPRTEYWITSAAASNNDNDDSNEPVDVTVSSRRYMRWAKIKEDRLKLVSDQGTLLLRFYSDLEDFEHHLERLTEENEQEGHLTKDVAFQWVQTVGRICGKEQLKESLPHFGDDDSEELRDYLEVVHHDKHHKTPKHSMKRATSFGNMQPLGSVHRSVSAGDAPQSRSPKTFRKSASMGPEAVPSTTPNKHASFRRSQSIESSDHALNDGQKVSKVTFHRSLSSSAQDDSNKGNNDSDVVGILKKQAHPKVAEEGNMIEITFSSQDDEDVKDASDDKHSIV